MLNVTVKLDGLDAFKRKLAPERIQKALIRALDKTAKQGKTEAQRQIRQTYALKLKDVSEKITVDIHPSRLEAIVQARGGRLPLILFGARQQGVRFNIANKNIHRTTRIRGENTGGVSVEIIRGQRKVIKGAFITGVGHGKHIGVFQRAGSKRLPIREKVTIDAPQMFGSRRVMEATRRRVTEQWQKNLSHELDWVMRGK